MDLGASPSPDTTSSHSSAKPQCQTGLRRLPRVSRGPGAHVALEEPGCCLCLLATTTTAPTGVAVRCGLGRPHNRLLPLQGGPGKAKTTTTTTTTAAATARTPTTAAASVSGARSRYLPLHQSGRPKVGATLCARPFHWIADVQLIRARRTLRGNVQAPGFLRQCAPASAPTSRREPSVAGSSEWLQKLYVNNLFPSMKFLRREPFGTNRR